MIERCEEEREVAELLVMELKLAAARTESVSSLPAFFAFFKEFLRRKLDSKRLK
ncbi:MAG: hypothetical protein ACR2MD_13445 [Aridibacter sp.]